jgi:predicted PurR-regulated permease PerM
MMREKAGCEMKRVFRTFAGMALVTILMGTIARADTTSDLQSQIDQQASQLRMQQQLQTQQQSLNAQQQQLQTQHVVDTLQMRSQLDQQSARAAQILQQQEARILQLQQSMKPANLKVPAPASTPNP